MLAPESLLWKQKGVPLGGHFQGTIELFPSSQDKTSSLIIKSQALEGNLNPILEYRAPKWILSLKTQRSIAIMNPGP